MDSSEPVKAGRREWIGLAVLALACVVYAMDLTVLTLAVPHLSEDLQPTSAQLLWIADIYGFMVAGALITMGTRRPDRTPAPAPVRRGGLRTRVPPGRVLDERRDADLRAGRCSASRARRSPRRRSP